MIEWICTALAAGGAAYAVGARQLMRGVLGLAIAFIGVAGLFGTMGAWYLAAGQIFLFVGGVVTLFVLAFNFAPTPAQRGSSLAAAVVAIVAFVTLAASFPQASGAAQATLKELAAGFFIRYGWVLNVAILLLLSAIIGAHYLLEEDA